MNIVRHLWGEAICLFYLITARKVEHCQTHTGGWGLLGPFRPKKIVTRVGSLIYIELAKKSFCSYWPCGTGPLLYSYSRGRPLRFKVARNSI